MLAEELGLEGKTEDSLYAKRLCSVDDCIDDLVADALVMEGRFHCDGTDLGEIFPENMECAASNDFIALDCNNKFLNALKECDCLLLEHLARCGEGIDDCANLLYIAGASWTNRDRHEELILFRLHKWEEDRLANSKSGECHQQAIDAHSKSTHRWHGIFHRA